MSDYDLRNLMLNRIAHNHSIDQSWGRKKYGDTYLDTDRPLTGKFMHYLTDEYGSECIDVTDPNEKLDHDYQDHLNKNMPDWWQDQDQDEDFIGKFRAECEQIDKE